MIDTITKRTICESIPHEKFQGYGRTKKKDLVDAMFKILREKIIEGRRVYLQKIGVINVVFKEGGRPVRNPKTGEEMKMHDTVGIKLSHNSASCSRKGEADKFTKCMFIDALTEYTKDEMISRAMYGELINSLHRIYEEDTRIEIRGIGSFSIKHRNARLARNPKTGEKVNKEAHKVIWFRAGKGLIKDAYAAYVERCDKHGKC